MISEPNQASCHELRVIVVNGKVFRVDLHGATRISFSRAQFLTMCLFSAVVALFNPPMFGISLPLPATFLYWLVVVYVVTVLWLLQFWLIDALRRWTGIELPVLGALSVLLGIAGTVWLNYAVSGLVFDLEPMTAWQVWMVVLRYFLIALVIEVVVAALVLPRFEHVVFETPLRTPAARVLTPVPPTPVEPEPASAPTSITVNDRTIPLHRLRWMKSVEHYVEFHCDTDSLTERATLRDMVGQAAGWDGIQPHRSWWVSRRAVDRMIRKGANTVLLLTDGTEVPVSRHRRAEVEAWISA